MNDKGKKRSAPLPPSTDHRDHTDHTDHTTNNYHIGYNYHNIHHQEEKRPALCNGGKDICRDGQTGNGQYKMDNIMDKLDNNGENGDRDLVTTSIKRSEKRSSVRKNNSKRPHVFTMHLLKKYNELGLEIAGGRGSSRGDVGIFVIQIIEGSNAEKDGRICVGDEITRINGVLMKTLNVQEVLDLLKISAHVVQLKIASKNPPKERRGSGTSSPALAMEPNSPSFVFDLLLRKDVYGRGLGFSVSDGAEFGRHDTGGIFVKNIFVSGVAAEDGTLKKGDEILQINGESLHHLNYMAAMIKIKNAVHGYVKMKVRRRQRVQYDRSQSAATIDTTDSANHHPSFHRGGSDRTPTLTRHAPLYSRNRKPPRHSPLLNRYRPPTPLSHEARFQPIKVADLPMTSSVNRLQRHQSSESTDSSSSIESFSSLPITTTTKRVKSPTPRMGISAKHRIHRRKKSQETLMQRRSQSESDLQLMSLYIHPSREYQDSSSDDTELNNQGPGSLPCFVNAAPMGTFKPQNANRDLNIAANRDRFTANRDVNIAANRDRFNANRDQITANRDQITAKRELISKSTVDNKPKSLPFLPPTYSGATRDDVPYSSLNDMHLTKRLEEPNTNSLHTFTLPRQSSREDSPGFSTVPKCTKLNKPRSDLNLPGTCTTLFKDVDKRDETRTMTQPGYSKTPTGHLMTSQDHLMTSQGHLMTSQHTKLTQSKSQPTHQTRYYSKSGEYAAYV